MKRIQRLLRLLYFLLYHQFAWSYDIVAAFVSLGRWNRWVRAVLPYADGRVLEVGFGPGHLQRLMFERGLQPVGLDESRQMTRQAHRRLEREGRRSSLVRGRAQHLPFPAGLFNAVVSTFPDQYIFEAQAIHELYRVLAPGGRLVILPMAWITGSKPLERLAAWLFRISGETIAIEKIVPAIQAPLNAVGFYSRHEIIETQGSRLLLILAEKMAQAEANGD